ncbi:hypothetical protein N7448_009739 [Penicillium atrosanguineum]|uniref:F-box domain-containing protein n=1 Tax=Penicillium atrosanguineum TaxID=1132637 RepID=A0A9W9PZ81_9EURO|nr:uncharacterized protein N7443_006989 [Penicillium atrosanguineum]KAJ5123642.1 hypothetical protein N7448_009739 [Penicillium atrosanguineum]KAJ5142270.1 hypothetical protein N7526_003265 [Penicillium atrosanguineum]KAJ5298869.1 hypothetical protein N7443_006989 [Penicillium atrosanguineum]KAJ5320869.1 hypothetical protein N7476_003871 [Penicillium atrosanguineum]
MSFLELPLEIQQRILSNLLSNSDVAALSIQCRALHSISDMATRKKYHHISVCRSEDGIDAPFGLLMETKSQRGLSDEDTKLVQAAVRKAGFTGPDEHQVVNMLMQRLDGTSGGFDDCGREPQISFLSRWSSLDSGAKPQVTFIAQALTAILIAVSPNLVSMVMAEPFCGGYKHPTEEYPLAKFLRQANSEPERKPYLQNLRDVYFININNSNETDEFCYQEMDFYGCCDLVDNLPSIESVSADLVEDDQQTGKSDFVEKCSNISRISLHHSSVTSVYLARLIWSCKSLREFQYSIGGRSSIDGGYPMVNPKTLLKVLCGHKDTLEIFDFDCRDVIHLLDNGSRVQPYETPFDSGIDEKERIFLKAILGHGESLKEFVGLKRLSVGIEFLLYLAKGVSGESDEQREMVTLAEYLPDSLEYLCVRGYQRGVDNEHDEQMKALMAFFKTESSNLKEVVGIEESIPHSTHVDDIDDEESIWSLQERGYEEFYM